MQFPSNIQSEIFAKNKKQYSFKCLHMLLQFRGWDGHELISRKWILVSLHILQARNISPYYDVLHPHFCVMSFICCFIMVICAVLKIKQQSAKQAGESNKSL